MKRTKLFFPLLACLSLSPTISIVSCGDNKSTSEYIAEYIINPSKLKDKVHLPKPNFKDSLKSLSNDDLKKELIYDLFISFNKKGEYKLNPDDSFGSLYEEKKVAIKTNITKCGLEFREDKLMCYFLGYVSFVFLTDYSNMYKQNNYVMLTFDIQNQEVEIDENNCSLCYKINSTPFEKSCVGFAKIKYEGDSEVMQYIETINTNDFLVKNSHNWSK